MIKKTNFEKWKKELDQDQMDFILEDYFSTHPDYNKATECIHEVYS